MIPSREWSILSGLSGDALVPWNRSMPPEVSPSPVSTPAAERIGHGFAWLVTLAWTLLIGAAASVNYANPEWDAIQHARSVADAYIDKDLAVHATRPIEGDFAVVHGIRSHLTGLVVKNPDNAPTPWERRALEQLAAGARDVVEDDHEGGQAVLRVMRPVFMEQACMKCHGDMNISVGDLRGGISTTLPMAPYLLQHRQGTVRAVVTHLSIWCVGLVGIAWNARRYRERARERARALLTAQRDERRIVEVLAMSERLDAMTEREIIQEGLEAAVRLTDSKIGFFHFVNEDQNSIELVTWSKDTIASYCHAAYDTHYPIERAGVWADCARLHQPVVHNDYPGLAVKRGLPEGHAPLTRLLSVPVIESGTVRVVTGVGNKARLYDDADLRLVQLLANDVWKLVQRKRADTGLRESEHRLREAQRVANMGSWRVDHGTGVHVWSDQMYALFGVDRATFTPTAETILERAHPDDRQVLATALRRAATEARPADFRVRIVRRTAHPPRTSAPPTTSRTRRR
jgi:GAF domain-containing protein